MNASINFSACSLTSVSNARALAFFQSLMSSKNFRVTVCADAGFWFTSVILAEKRVLFLF